MIKRIVKLRNGKYAIENKLWFFPWNFQTFTRFGCDMSFIKEFETIEQVEGHINGEKWDDVIEVIKYTQTGKE